MIGSMMESSLSVATATHPNIRYFNLDALLWLAAPPPHLKYIGEVVEIVKRVSSSLMRSWKARSFRRAA